MLSRAAMLPGLMLPILLALSTAPGGSSSLRLKGAACITRIPHVVTYLQAVRYTQLVRTKKCVLLIFCSTAYRTRAAYRMEQKSRTEYKISVKCCKDHHEVNSVCVPDYPTTHLVTTPKEIFSLSTTDIPSSSYEVPTSTVVQQTTISEDSNQQTSTWISRNSTETVLIGKNKELHITDSNQTTLIIGFIGCILSVFIMIVVIVIYRRRKKAAKYMGEIPYSPDVLPLPSKSEKDCSATKEGLNYRNFPTKDENHYMSMDSGCPAVKMMLATRGSGYRFSGLENDPRRRADTLYVAPDSMSYNNHNVTDCPEPKFPSKPQPDKGSRDIYMNGRDINMADEDEDGDGTNIYSVIKAKNFKQMDPSGDENGYSFIRMDCVKESTPEERECEAETSLYSSAQERDNDDSNNGMQIVPDSQQMNEIKGDENNSLTQAKRRKNGGRQNEMETLDDACDSGIYTSISNDSDKNDEDNSDATYDHPKKKRSMDETKLNKSGSDYYVNCRRDSDESNYDIPPSHNEDPIYSDIAPSFQITNTPVVVRTS